MAIDKEEYLDVAGVEFLVEATNNSAKEGREGQL